MKEPRVKDIIKNYQKGNLKQVHEYLTQPDMVVDPSTWAGSVLNLIENKHYVSAIQLIELTAYKFIK
jgi:hypothetical protein